MGFLDSFKEAMQRGAEAAENYRERELAEQTEEKGMPLAQARPASRVPEPAHTDPGAPFDFTVKTEDPIIVKDPVTGNDFKFRLLSNGRAKMDNPSMYEGQDFKSIVKDTIMETVVVNLNNPEFLPDCSNVKALLMLSNRMIQPVTAELKSKGFTVAFKMLNVTKIQEQ